VVTDDKKTRATAPVNPETTQKAAPDEDSDSADSRRGEAEKATADPDAKNRPAANPGAIPDEPVVEIEGIDDTPAEPDGQKGASPKARPEGDKPHRVDPKELISRLADKNNVIMELTRKNRLMEKEAKALQDKLLRSAAEFDNFRKRSRKEWDLLKQQTKADVILEVLNVVDDFERAFSVVGDRDDDFVQGIRLIHNNLVATLNKLGVQRIEAHHAPFDPNYHMAVAQTDSKDVDQGNVVEVVQQGYILDDVVIRPARVVIAK
jgi:molecular chaperone GrpE